MPAQLSTPMTMTDCASPNSPAAHHAVSSAVAIKCAGRLYQVLQQTGYQQLHGLLSCQASSPDSTPLLRSSRRLGAAPLSQQPTASTHGVSHSRCTSGAAKAITLEGATNTPGAAQALEPHKQIQTFGILELHTHWGRRGGSGRLCGTCCAAVAAGRCTAPCERA